MEKIIAGIVAFNPEIKRFDQNIKSISKQVSKVIIIDNFSKNVNEIEEKINKLDNIALIKNKKNEGIAFGLNKIMDLSQEEDADWVLTLDQDSIAPTNLIKKLMQYKEKDIAILCPYILDINRDNDNPKDEFNYVDRAITSGSLTRVSAWKDVNGFDELMFIDGVDFDFSDRLVKKGWKIKQVNSVQLIHEIGKISIKKFFGISIIVRNHSAFRKYYISRNIIYLDKKNNVSYFPLKAIMRVLKQLILVILYENDKLNKIKMIIKGMKDGFLLVENMQ